MIMHTQGFVSPREAAKMLGFSPATLANWRAQGKGPKSHRFGARVRYALTDLDEWITRSASTTTCSTSARP